MLHALSCRPAIIVMLALIAACTLVHHVQGNGGTPGPGKKPKPPTTMPAMSLHHRMEAIGETWDKIESQAKKNELGKGSLDLVVLMQAHAVLAKSEVPDTAKKMTGEAQAQFLVTYRKSLMSVVDQLMKLELALVESRNTDATEIMKSINKAVEEAHGKFNP